MKKFIPTVAALILGGAAVFSFAQAEHSHQGRGGWGMGMFGHRMAQQLQLTDAQQQQIKGILQAEKPKMQPLMLQLKAERQQMDALVTSGAAFDEAQARTIASQQSQTMTNLAVERARAESQIFAVLTPDQRTKAEALKKEFSGRGFRRHPQPGAAQPQAPGL